MLTISLTSKQRKELQDLEWQEDVMWERAQYILLLSEGGKISEIAKLFNRHESSIHKWAECYIEYGVEGLKDILPLNNSAVKRESILHELSKLLGMSILK